MRYVRNLQIKQIKPETSFIRISKAYTTSDNNNLQNEDTSDTECNTIELYQHPDGHKENRNGLTREQGMNNEISIQNGQNYKKDIHLILHGPPIRKKKDSSSSHSFSGNGHHCDIPIFRDNVTQYNHKYTKGFKDSQLNVSLFRKNEDDTNSPNSLIKNIPFQIIPNQGKENDKIKQKRSSIPRVSRLASRSSRPTEKDFVAKNIKYAFRCPMDWNNYHRLAVIHDFMDELEQHYPSICTNGCIGRSLEGRDLKILRISNSNAGNTPVWIDAGIHAREWIAPAVATFVADHIARNFNNLPTYITNKDWYFVPVVNPDGYEYSHTDDRMWRKNRAKHAGKCVGVDLNRNFSYGWGGKGSSDVPTQFCYKGPEPFSEPESRAIRDMILNSGVSFKVYMTLHSYGQVIVFPLSCSTNLCPDYIRLLGGATVMSKAIHQTFGNIYKVGISKDVMYQASGTSNDWSYGVAGIPYCYLFELRSKKYKFKLPKEEIEETGNEILNAVKALMRYVDETPLKDQGDGKWEARNK